MQRLAADAGLRIESIFGKCCRGAAPTLTPSPARGGRPLGAGPEARVAGMDNSEHIERLRNELVDSIRLGNDDGVRRAYQDLLRAGQPRKEIMDEVIHLATARQPAPPSLTEKAFAVELSAVGEKRRPRIADHENHFMEQVAAHLPLLLGEPGLGGAPQTASERSIEKAETRRPAGSFSRLQRAAVFMSIAINALVAGTGGAIFFVTRGEDKQLGATAALPSVAPPELMAPRYAGPVPAMEETAGKAALTVPEIGVVSTPGASISEVGSLPVAVIPEERVNEGLPSAVPKRGDVAAKKTDIAPTKGGPDPALMARGDASFAQGDVVAARRFYELAANAGDAQAALRLGQTYDPAFLAQIQFRVVRPDASAAAYWYQKADKLGAPEAVPMLWALANDLGFLPQRKALKR